MICQVNKYIVAVILLFASAVYSQDKSEFQKVYEKTYLETSIKDLPRALEIADSLYKASDSPRLQIKSLMLSATLHLNNNDIKEAVDYAIEAEKISNSQNDFDWGAKIYGFLASNYRNLGMTMESRRYAEKGLAMAEKIKDTISANNTRGLFYQELAFDEQEQGNYRESVKYLQLSIESFSNGKPHTNLLLTTEKMFGDNYYYLGDFDKSIAHYKKAEKLSLDCSDNFWLILVYAGMVKSYAKLGDMANAGFYLEKVESLGGESVNLNLLVQIFEAKEIYSEMSGDKAGQIASRHRKDSVRSLISRDKLKFLDETFYETKLKTAAEQKKGKQKTFLLVLSGLALIMGACFFFWRTHNYKKKIDKFKAIADELNQKFEQLGPEASDEGTNNKDLPDVEVVKREETADKPLMTEETRFGILKKLKAFENKHLFTDSNTSLASVAVFCETNSKYLSAVIREDKGRDFNGYINELRVNFLINLLKNNTKFRNYKISVLAEEAGFSSHNKLSQVFKSITGITPSAFLKLLKEDKLG